MSGPQISCIDGQADVFALHATRTVEYPFLLESRQIQSRTGRYSFLFTECSIERALRCDDLAGVDAFFDALSDNGPIPGQGEQPPFIGGWFLFFAYELALSLESHLEAPPAWENQKSALAHAIYCGGAIVVDHIQDKTWFVSESEQCAQHQQALQEACIPTALNQHLALRFGVDDADRYLENVARTVTYIEQGDVYQANLSRRWRGGAITPQAMLQAYAQLRERNAASFAASVQWPGLVLASASPERLFCIRDGEIETRPIAGTRARGGSAQADELLIQELLAHPKEQAEHIMLVDLERNDLGRICRAGTVRVTELLGIESYASVHHIVSNISGTLKPDLSLRDILKAVFPGGTITGCPKIRCMQIITELERAPRGAYTGSLGYRSNCGRMDFNILIRTLVHEAGQVHFNAGAGIVADSIARAELAETEAKAAGIMRALSL